MQPIGNGRLSGKKICGLLFCMGVLFLGAVCCGRGVPLPYSQGFSLSSGQCQGGNTAPAVGEATLTMVASAGPNITICTLRASDGTLLRHYDLTVHGDVVGHGDGLLFVNERGGDQGNTFALCAVHISDGLERWCQTQLTYSAFATVSNGIIYASSSDQTSVAAVSERDGRILWTFNTQADPALSSHPSIVIGNGAVYVSTFQNLQTGSPTPTTGGIDQTSGVRSVCALRASDGQQLWCKSLDNQSINSMAIDANALYVQTMNNAAIFALGLADGSVRWSRPLSVPPSPYLLPHMLVARGMIFTNESGADSAGNDHLYALSASDGRQLWNKPYNTMIVSITATDQSLYVVTNSGALSVLNTSDSAPAWSHGGLVTPNASFCSNNTCNLIVEYTVAYILLSNSGYTSNPHLLALRTSDGKTLWEDQGCVPGTPTPIASTSTPTGNVSPGNGRCYWQSRTVYGYLNVRLLLIGN